MSGFLHRLRKFRVRFAVLKRFRFQRREAASSKPILLPSEHDQFFRYNSGRWIYNEQEQLSIRYARFNVDALKDIATAEAGAKHCLQMVKIDEGSFNKIFMLTFDNGVKLVAKIPCPLVAPRRLCTASEVATMDYARNILNIPVPRVLKYSIDPDASSVGVEYILMEHVQGVELHKRMDELKGDATHFVDQLIDIECKFSQYRFSQIGSLYYKEDVSPELQQRPLYADGVEGDGSDRFRIGPYVEWDVWRGQRSNLDVDRGPWPDALSYIRAIVGTEQKWLSTYAVPYEPRHPFCRYGSENEPGAHVRLLDKFLEVIPSILPPSELCAPVLWHNDLHASNVFVPSEGKPDIMGLIDWQGISVRPLFLQAIFADCVRYQGDERITIPPGMTSPTLPPDFDTCSEQDKAHLKVQHRRAIIHKYYETLVRQRHPLSFAAQSYPYLEFIIPPILSASRTWYEGMYHLRQVLLGLDDAWGNVAPDTAFPITWDAEEVAAHREAYPKWMAYEERVEKLVRGLQLEGDGWVSNERCDEVMKRSKAVMKDWDPDVLGGPYPFQDGGRSWFLS